MAVGQGYSKTATNGLVFAFDTGDTRNSFLGRPTTNLIEGYGLSNYNNVGGSVTTNLTQTSDSYRGAPIWIQTLTPLDGSGVSWLSNGNNPGLGVVTSGGGGLANRYTGHSIFFKPTVPMNSSPIFTHYSNIGGWQTCCNYEDMGDGWFRAKVIWYDTTTRSDGKYWAINPLSATLNTPITIYWAGPFKEDLNSQYISQYTPTSRSNTQSLLDLSGNSTLTVAEVSFDSNVEIAFDGTTDYIDTTKTPSQLGMYDASYTAEAVCYPTLLTSDRCLFGTDQTAYRQGLHLTLRSGQIYMGHFAADYAAGYADINAWNHIVYRYDASTSTASIFKNGVLQGSGGIASFIGTTNVFIGREFSNPCFVGNIDVAKIYNRALTVGEILQNYNHYKTRFNLP
jgi:hypothetical protein